MERRLIPSICPSCGNPLHVRRLACPQCATSVEGDFVLPVLAKLNLDEQTLLLSLFTNSGNLKALAREYGVSYPTIRNRVDDLNARIRTWAASNQLSGDAGEINGSRDA